MAATENLATLLTSAARRFSPRPAFPSSTYCQFLEAANAVAAELRQAGLRAHEPVHVQVSNQPLDLAAYLGVWLAGGVVVPVHRGSPDAVTVQMIAKTKARFAWEGGLRAVGKETPPARTVLDGAALVVFTSGSSGMPKGAVLSHDAFAGKLAAIQSLLQFAEGERTMLVLNITFSFGIWVALLTLLQGGELLTRERFSADVFLRELAEERVNRVAVVPTMMRSLILDLAHERLEAEGGALAHAGALRHVLIGGETLGQGLAATLRRLFAPADLIDIYGLTETSTCDFFLLPADAPRYPGSIGRPSPHVRYRIVTDDGAAVAAGDIGELLVASPYLMSGYLDEPALQPIRDGWLATGDLARERAPGLVEIAGRKKELIYRGGHKIAPQEIEFACSAHPKVAAALAIGRPDGRLGERIHALIVPRERDLSAAEVRRFLRERLERWKQPDVLYFATELPAGRTGKADRGRFAVLVAEGRLSPVEEAA
ncbi:MAG: class I adenylate-forming enzyme family protein [Burkholderiales bacterium]